MNFKTIPDNMLGDHAEVLISHQKVTLLARQQFKDPLCRTKLQQERISIKCPSQKSCQTSIKKKFGP